MDTIKEYTPEHMKKWQWESNYGGEDMSNYYILVAHTRDSNIMDESNFECIKAELEKEFSELFDNDGILVCNFGHWAVGWVEAIMIHENQFKALEYCDEIKESLQNYPVYNDEDYYEKENELIEDYIEEIVKDFISEHEILDNLTDEEIENLQNEIREYADYWEVSSYDEVLSNLTDEEIESRLGEVSGWQASVITQNKAKIEEQAFYNGHVLSAWFYHYASEAVDCINCKERYTLDNENTFSECKG